MKQTRNIDNKRITKEEEEWAVIDAQKEAERVAGLSLRERRFEALRVAISNDELMEALFEKFAGDNTKWLALHAIREQIKIDIT